MDSENGIHESPDEVRASKHAVGQHLSSGKAFDEIVRTHGPRMLSVIKRYVVQEADAYDALQDAFIAAFRKADQFRGSSSLGTWLHTVACRAALMKLRSQKRLRDIGDIDRLLPVYESDGHRSSISNSWPTDPHDVVANRETCEIVRQSIAELPEMYRVVLMLRDIDGLSTEEAAECMGVNQGAIKTRLNRARHALRLILAKRLPASDKDGGVK